jgi:hypothetical protein
VGGDQVIYILVVLIIAMFKLAGGPGPEIIIVTLLVHCIMIYLFGYGQNVCQSGITNKYGKYNLCIIVVQRLLKIHR